MEMLIANHRGLGATQASTSGLIAASGAVAGSTFGTMATTILATSAVGGPFGIAIGAGIVAVTAVLGILGVGNGCGQTCVTASKNANEIEAQMKANLAAFQSGQIDQSTALSNYAILWNAFQQMCEQVGGDQAVNCVGDRQAGACKWRDAQGACWNWDSGYREPIAEATPPTSPAISSILGNMSTAEWALLGLVGVGIVAAVEN